MKQFRLKNKYPGLPDDWDNGMIIGHGERGSASYYSPINGKYTDKHIPYIQCKNYPIHWEEVKQINYEILTVTAKPNHPNLPVGSIKNSWININMDYFNINSVKRLSDGEVFTVGDKITAGIIKRFFINGNSLICVGGKNIDMNISLHVLIPYKKPLFITEDGIEAYFGDKYWCIDKNDKSKIYTQGTYGNGKIRTEEFYFFSTKEAAEDYILMNKPCLSLIDVNSVLAPGKSYQYHSTTIDKLTKLIQERCR